MTYKTRQEVLRAAADWMDVCDKAGVKPNCKWNGVIGYIETRNFTAKPEEYEFPLALLEGKEVWVGSELYGNNSCEPPNQRKVVAKYFANNHIVMEDGGWYEVRFLSWNQPKPATVMVELPMRLVEFRAGRIELNNDEHDTLLLAEDDACKKALENL